MHFLRRSKIYLSSSIQKMQFQYLGFWKKIFFLKVIVLLTKNDLVQKTTFISPIYKTDKNVSKLVKACSSLPSLQKTVF